MKLPTYRVVRWIHGYSGLFFGPAVLLFAFSTLIFNHPQMVGGQGPTEQAERVVDGIQVPGLEGLPLGRSLADQLGLSGEIDWVGLQPKEGRIVVMVSRPGWYSQAVVHTETGKAEISEKQKGFLDRILYLHKRPGPHVAHIRGNWWFIRAWGIVVDSLVIAILMLSLTGVLLWWRLKRERSMGFGALVSGSVAIVFLIWLLAGASA